MEKEEIADFERAMDGPCREDYITKGQYATNLQTAWEIFGRDAVYTTFKHDFETDPASAIAGIYSFLGVDTEFRPDALERRLNESGREKTAVLKTDLSADGDVMVRGKRLDRLRNYGQRVSRSLGVESMVERVGSPILSAAEQTMGAYIPDGSSGTETSNSIAEPNRETKRRVYREYFADEVETLEKLLATDLSHWKYER